MSREHKIFFWNLDPLVIKLFDLGPWNENLGLCKQLWLHNTLSSILHL